MNAAGPTVLVVEDEPQMRRFLRATLETHGYRMVDAPTGQQGIAEATTSAPDIVLLDLGLPDVDGVDVVRRLREWTDVPIVIVSARDQEKEKIRALDAGADDYLTKPFSTGELLARMRVAFRRALRLPDEPIFKLGDLTVDFARRVVSQGDTKVQLTPTEYDLLRVLVTQAGRVLTHRQLLREVWGDAYELDTHTLRVNISNLRRKIEPDPNRPRYISTEPGVGYRLQLED